jgi:hypothetical protein
MSDRERWAWRPQNGPQKALVVGLRSWRNGQYRHGERTKAAIAEQRKYSALLKMLHEASIGFRGVRVACGERRVIESIRRRKASMSKIKLTNYQAKQSRIVEGVCVPILIHGLEP